MRDPRIAKLAKILTDYSVKIKEGDIIKIKAGVEAQDLVLELTKNILKKKAFPLVDIQLPGYAYTYFKYASDAQLKTKPQFALFESKKIAAWINIVCDYNTKELTNIDPQKLLFRRKATKKISDMITAKDNWTLFLYPTHSLAQDAHMSLREFEDFVFKSVLLDWKKQEKKQQKLQNLLDKSSYVRIVGNDTDISFSIKDRTAVNCCGRRNMPDGEVYIAPVEDTVNGKIAYSFPATHGSREVSGIKLEFRNGKVISATARKNQDYLRKTIKTDKGASYVGEFGIGTNYSIKKHTGQILFDEKQGGTIHLALGMSFPKGGGRNKSAIHWDMIKDLRKNGELYLDNKLIQKNGKFLIKL